MNPTIPDQNPFVVTQLRPEARQGGGEGVYQLTAASANPVRFIGRDEDGYPVEDTIPTVHWRYFVMKDGSLNKVPLRTGSVFSMAQGAVEYEQMVTTDLINAGCIPLWCCPYNTDFNHLTNGPFVKVPEGETPCSGDYANGGCSHMKKVIEARKTKALDRYKVEQKQFAAMKDDQVEAMAASIAGAVTKGISLAQSAVQTQEGLKNRLRSGKGEE